MLILGFILGIIATIGLIYLIHGQTAASSNSGTEAPAYHASRQSVRLGPARSDTQWQPVSLHTRLDLETPDIHLTYKSSGPPDAVLYGNAQFLTALGPSLSSQATAHALPR